MVTHIVVWKLKDSAGGRSRSENAALIKERLEGLRDVIPGLLRIEVGIDFSGTEESANIALYSEFESREALAVYQEHPAHKAVMPLIREARSERRVVDYER
jgi:quinol monooxygenase YgiN